MASGSGAGGREAHVQGRGQQAFRDPPVLGYRVWLCVYVCVRVCSERKGRPSVRLTEQ